MPNTVAFTGFSAGGAVTIDGVTASTWGVAPSGSSVWDLTPTGGVSVTINPVRSQYQVAPDPVWFDLDLSGFDTNTPAGATDDAPCVRDKAVFWDLGEDATFTAAQKVAEMDTVFGSEFMAARYRTGPHASAVYRTDGLKTIRCMVLEPPSATHPSGAVGYAETTVSVGVLSSIFSNSDVHYVHSTNGGNPPTGATLHQTLSAALTAVDSANVPKCIMLADGETFSITAGVNHRPNATGVDTAFVMMAEPGSAVRPKVNFSGGTFLSDAQQIDGSKTRSLTMFQGIDFDGGFDVLTNSGSQSTFIETRRNNYSAHDTVFDDVLIEDFFIPVVEPSEGIGSDDYFWFMSNTEIRGHGSAGMFGLQDRYLSIRGSRIASKPGQRVEMNSTVSLGAMRIGRPGAVDIQASDIVNYNGYHLTGDYHVEYQPALRIFDAVDSTSRGRRMYVGGCYISSPRKPIRMVPFDGGTASEPLNALLESNMIVGGFQAGQCIEVNHSGVRFRNNVIQSVGTTRLAGPGAFFDISTAGTTSTINEGRNIEIHNNTCINQAGASVSLVNNAVGHPNLVNENNIIHQPAAGSTPDATLDVLGTIDPEMPSYIHSDGSVELAYAVPASHGQVLVPATGSAALDDSTGTYISYTSFAAPFDTDPRIATADRDRGAVEV